ncbi:MAG TPA: autotransporter-associated beta strand repeat-containing protein, partial [Rariglobus sp.]
MKNTSSIPTRLTAAGSLALLFSAFLPVASAADLTWINTGATANWDTSSSFWNNGSADVAWTDNNAAVFVGNGVFRTITLNQNVQATELRGDGTSGGTIKLTGASMKLDVPQFNTTANANFDVDVVITGSHGLTKTGNGRITLYKASDYTGATELNATNAGTGLSEIYLKINNALSTTAFNIVGGTAKSRLILNGTANGSAGISQEFSALTGDGRILARTGNNTLTINTVSGATSTFSGGLNEFNVTTGQSLSLVIKGAGTQVLTGTTNTYVGATTIQGGTLRLGANLSGTSSVTVSGGTLSSNVANVNLGLGGVSMSAGAINIRDTGAAGTFTLAANQNFSTTGGSLNFDLLGSSSFDQIIGSGTGSFSLIDTTLVLSGSFTSVAGTYQLFSGFGGTNSVSGLTITGIGSGFTGSLDTTGLLTISVASIPEPSTYAALAGIAT